MALINSSGKVKISDSPGPDLSQDLCESILPKETAESSKTISVVIPVNADIHHHFEFFAQQKGVSVGTLILELATRALGEEGAQTRFERLSRSASEGITREMLNLQTPFK